MTERNVKIFNTMEIRKQIDDLTTEVWIFNFIRGHLYLDAYALVKKDSKRHKKCRYELRYERLNRRDSNIEERDVPLSDNIRKEALKVYCSKIKCLKWSERN
jgi:hypothetical protein